MEDMVDLLVAARDQYISEIRELFDEYLVWATARINHEFDMHFDAATYLEDSMQHLDGFMPPSGRLLLAFVDGQPAGIAGLKQLEDRVGEIKRMYVRPAQRGKGIGGAMLERLLAEAGQIGYERVRLDSSRFMQDAHRLYRAAGFKDIPAYEGSEIPPEFRKNWIFMELALPSN